MLTRDEAQKLASKILSWSKFPECTVGISVEERASVRFANNGITTSGLTLERQLTISSSREGRTGTVRLSDVDDDAVREALRQSEETALISPVNPEHMPPLGEQKYASAIPYDEPTASARSPQMIPHIKAIVEAARERGLVAAGFIQRQLITESLATKHGLFAYQRYADSRLSTTVRRADGSSSGWASQASVRLGELDGAAAARIAVDKCVRWNKPAKVEPGKYTVVLEPAAVAALVPLMSNSLSARVTEQGRSFLSRKGGGTLLGEKLFPEFITLHSDPLNPAFPVLVWGVDGLPLRRVTWIEKGVVKNLAYDRYWASKADVPPTPTTAAPAGFPRTASDFVLEGSDRSLDQLIKSVDRGLLVTRFWYVRALNPQTVQLTGLTRDGLFLIEKGQVSAPVMNLRFNESPVRLLQNARMLGQALRTTAERGRCIAPAMVAADFNFSSISDAV